MKDQEKISITFRIKEIELLETELKTPAQQLPENALFHFEINIEHRVNVELNLIIVFCTVNILNESKGNQLGMIKVACVFVIENIQEFIDPETKAINLQLPFLTSLNSITISTVRGVMFSTFKGTFLNNAILPILDPTQLVPSIP